jgi:predicted aminopeptidase
VLYIKDDSNFNEAFATFVEQVGVRSWLQQRGEADRIAAYDTSQARVEEFVGLLKNTRDALQALYAQELPPASMRAAKQAVFADMLASYAALKQSWDGYAGYDNWFNTRLNNARLVAVSTYRRNVPAFYAMYEEAGEDMTAFYARAKEVAEMPYSERQLTLDGYLAVSATASGQQRSLHLGPVPAG